MLILLSPAKNLDFSDMPFEVAATKPSMLAETKELSQVTKSLSSADLRRLMKISENLANLNYERFQDFSGRGGKPAALAFNGDVYLGLDAKTLEPVDLDFAQDHLRILSGFYGLLRPLDRIEPYRLEMGIGLETPRGKTLYNFWGDRIAKEVRKGLRGHEDKTVVNLASKEYFSAVDQAALGANVITPVFKEEKDGKLRQLQFFAKRARGMMARWAIEHRITDAEQLKAFDQEGYRFDPDRSDSETWLFHRQQPSPKVG